MTSDQPPAIHLRPDVLSKLQTAFNESAYRDAIKNSSTYNNRLVVERKTRLPFIDSQTGVAQNDCFLWMQHWERMPGATDGQLYTYPVRRWKKKRRQYLLTRAYTGPSAASVAMRSDAGDARSKEPSGGGAYEMNGSNGVEIIPVTQSADDVAGDKFFPDSASRDASWISGSEFDESANLDLHDQTGEPDEPDTDPEDYEEYTSKKKKRKKAEAGSTPGQPGRRKKSAAQNDDKPYQCEICKMRYKTRPGLTYHYAHIHANETPDRRLSSLPAPPPPEDEDSHQSLGAGGPGSQSGSSLGANFSTGPLSASNGLNSRGSSQTAGSSSNSPLPPAFTGSQAAHGRMQMLHGHSNFPGSPSSRANQLGSNAAGDEPREPGSKPRKSSAPSSYCDFCLGNSEINKKTKSSEEMISCSDCGRSAHPTCLQFTANMLLSVKKYRWQCIECKSCGLCGTSDNDDQLLFCDDCDRGYHMYCLKPPLSEPPEGSWSCHLCMDEYHRPKPVQPTVSTGAAIEQTPPVENKLVDQQPPTLPLPAVPSS